ncbi:MAG: anthranilate synthase component II [Flavobacteriales bacterium]
MRTVIIDNYDSFTYNLQHYLEGVLEADVPVYRNDQIGLDALETFDNIVLSPGPGLPEQAGITMEVIRRFQSGKRILGVCLGHQAIGVAFGGLLKNLSTVHHGVSSGLNILQDDYLFANFPNESEVGRYHSWVVSNQDFPNCLEVLATDEQGEIMALRHKEYDIRGVQFHPESIMTPHGKTLILNWATKKW